MSDPTLATTATTTAPQEQSAKVAVKPGYKTSEMYMWLLAKVLTVVFASGLVTNNTMLQVAGIAAAWLTAAGYQVGRTFAKTATVVLLLALVAHTTACGASQRQQTITATFNATNIAAAAFEQLDAKVQHGVVEAAKNLPDGQAALTNWRERQLVVAKLLAGVYRGVAAAATLNNDQSLQGMLLAAALFAQEMQSLGIKFGEAP